MIPTSEGIWRWKRKDDGREFDLPLYDFGANIGTLCLKIKYLGEYYDIDDFAGGSWIAKVNHNPNGWITKQIRGWIHPEDFVRATCNT